MRLRDPLSFFESNYIPEPNSGCWLWERGLGSDGYGSLSVTSVRQSAKHGRAQRTHRFAWEFFRGPIPKGKCVLHRCDVRSCVNPDHLFLGTRTDNNADMVTKGRNSPLPSSRGEQNARAKLTENDVGEIRRRYQVGENWKILAKEYGVNHKTIWKVGTGRSWRGDR